MLKRLLISTIVVALLLIASGVFIVWRHPMAVFNWNNRRQLASAGFKKHVIESRVGPQTVFEAGSGQVVVLLHGAGDNAGSFTKVAPELASAYHVVIPDLAGHEASAPRKGPLTFQDVFDGVDAVVQSSSEGKPVILVGNSLGAWIASVYAYRYPDRVQRLILTGGGPLRGDRSDLARLPANREDARKLFDAVLDPGTPRPANFVLDDVVRISRTGSMARLAAAPDMEAFLLDSNLQELRTPVDLVWGDADQLVPLAYAKRLQAMLPASRLSVVSRCGHVPQQECPISYTKALMDTLKMTAPMPSAPVASVKQSRP